MLQTIKELCLTRLPDYYTDLSPVADIQVLTPVRKGLLGSINLNKELQEVLNPPNEALEEKTFGDRTFREGDKVMQIKNNYQMAWKNLEDFWCEDPVPTEAAKELGFELMDKIIAKLEDCATIEQKPQMAGRNLGIVVRSK